jgi:hypothetical protein
MAGIQPNAQYNVAAAGSLPVRIAAHQRRKMFSRFMLDGGYAEGILRVGVARPQLGPRTIWACIRTRIWTAVGSMTHRLRSQPGDELIADGLVAISVIRR